MNRQQRVNGFEFGDNMIGNHEIDPEWFATISTPGWQQRWLENFTGNQSMGLTEEDLVMDGWTDLYRRVRAKVLQLPPEQMTPEGMAAAMRVRRACFAPPPKPGTRRITGP